MHVQIDVQLAKAEDAALRMCGAVSDHALHRDAELALDKLRDIAAELHATVDRRTRRYPG